MPPPPHPNLTAHLDSARRDLLDLGLRNPLLNYRLLKARGVEVARTINPAAIFTRLVSEEKRIQFRPASPPLLANPAQATTSIPESDLPTTHDLPQLQKRLLATYTAARTSLEEQGVNTLYLALGMLCWTEDDASTESHRAPLLLIPVTLHRNDARDQFHLSFTGEEIGDNIALAEKLLSEFGIRNFPELPAREDIDIPDYFARIETLIRSRKGWRIEHTACCLGFFSFAKFLMYRDLNAQTWPDPARLLNHPILQALLGAAQFTDPASP